MAKRRETELDVAHYERQCYEIEVPGFNMYTIDDNMVLRSYKTPGSPRVLNPKANHHGGYEYNLWHIDENGLRKKRSFSPLRLYLCACAGLNPISTTLDDFEYDESGNVKAVSLRTRKGLQHKPGNIITSAVYRRQLTDKERQQARAARQEAELKALQKAIASDDYSEVLTMLWSYRQLVCSVMYVRFRISRSRAEELFSVAMEHVVRKFRKDCVVCSNFMGMIIKNTELALYNNA